MENVLVLFEAEGDFRDRLSGALPGMRVVFAGDGGGDRLDPALLGDTTVILGNPPAELLERCPQLKWLQLQSAGTDGYVSGELGPGVILTSATGGYGHSVSEHMVALTVTLMKKLHLYRDEQNRGRWQGRGLVKSIQGAVVLVVGLGDIGGEYARRMKGLGAYIIGLRRTEYPRPPYVDEQYLADRLEEVLPRADVAALAVPGVPANRGLLGPRQIARLKRGAIIINGGRGSAIDTGALSDALESGALDGAGLDVTDPEPLPPEHRLWRLENALITPHVAGGRNMPETGRYIMELNLENARRFMEGRPLRSRIDLSTGYRIPEPPEGGDTGANWARPL
jgi:phosphoglycerate dehydrogenase-like enzyme